ncbi:MAG: MAPEG family protein [Polyangiales bacterium]
MDPKLIFWPVVVQIALSAFIYIRLKSVKVAAVAAGGVDRQKAALHPDAWPDSVIKVNNNLRNQFEAPVLFYVVTIILFVLGAVNPVTLGLAWLFVLSRLVHAYIHTGSNIVKHRLRVFTLGLVAVLGMLAAVAYALV